jgi:mRNA-degrading endonuclease RelE of RelBE toxin-antitoxin system
LPALHDARYICGVRYRLLISEQAIAQLRVLPKEVRRNIGFRLESMCDDLQGDVKKLKAQTNHYRLRVGGHRVLSTLDGGAIGVYAVKDRKEAYD